MRNIFARMLMEHDKGMVFFSFYSMLRVPYPLVAMISFISFAASVVWLYPGIVRLLGSWK